MLTSRSFAPTPRAGGTTRQDPRMVSGSARAVGKRDRARRVAETETAVRKGGTVFGRSAQLRLSVAEGVRRARGVSSRGQVKGATHVSKAIDAEAIKTKVVPHARGSRYRQGAAVAGMPEEKFAMAFDIAGVRLCRAIAARGATACHAQSGAHRLRSKKLQEALA